ncbi:50S ribosomal protein L6 [Candidatus Woesebacteria bacterium CG_4_10_14_0_2_um_filter_39_14]|uniref:Large ribosomal subunit protein uL6 n=3 Tax=Microgenomates group TaxID=1794810 RepID=A0A2M6YPS5_9BACT|nr:MAG: 50S ribosomal protein L6 [Candidatus Shapirobacteria bacterium CG07_land_8_20_14_0_80_39_12]PIZ49092.1 MAG: 50S ribosomal protein L6 [Candidatus Woesebacteria bacterium CG_4_10_14_0_2_um_filter_39_14]PJA49253.1 MAG: 50S ribosomal protein L6 [Candidatus Shapirobacteria bacterium CG_4_9_14_3_um_filter_39_13]
MSRIGKQPVIIPEGVNVKIDGNQIVVSGPKGVLNYTFRPEMKVSLEEGKVLVKPKTINRLTKALFGTTRNLIANMVEGVTKGFSKTLKIVGTGYRASLEGAAEETKLILSLGFSHPVEIKTPVGIQFELEGNNLVKISGIDKALVGQTAAKIRDVYPPEPYKGKGIRYQEETPRRKAGKTGKAGLVPGVKL